MPDAVADRHTVTFEERDGKTDMTSRMGICPSKEIRDATRVGHGAGMRETMDQLTSCRAAGTVCRQGSEMKMAKTD